MALLAPSTSVANTPAAPPDGPLGKTWGNPPDLSIDYKTSCLQGFLLWARLDSNQGPIDYESTALTN